MGSGVITVGRRTYAVGLYWENSPSGRVVFAAKEAAQQPGQKADFFAVRAGIKDGHVPQFGLGQLASGHKAAMPSFAGCLANQQMGSWVGAFRAREGTVVTVVRDDLIVPDGDQLFLDENDARERVLQEISFGGLQKVYAPESWAIPGSDNMPISLLLDERRDVRLRAVATPKSVWIAGGVVGFLLLVGLGVVIYEQQVEAKLAAEQAAKMSALARARAAANQMGFGSQQAPPYPVPERKWESKPPVMDMVESCRVGLANIPAVIQGWHLTQMKCDGTSFAMGWTRSAKDFSSPPADWVILPNGASASSSVPLPKLTERGHEDLANPDDITRRYLAQNWTGTLTRLADDPPPPPPPDYKGPWNPPPPPWVKSSFTLTVPELPSLLPTYFHDVPGVVITGLSYKPGANNLGGSWIIEGMIYENRI